LREWGIKWDSIILGRPFRRGGLGPASLVFNGATWSSICCSVRPNPRKCLAIVSMCSRISSDTPRLPNSSSVSAVSLSQSANFNCGHTFRQRDTETRSKQSLKVGSDKPSRCNIIRSPGTPRCQGFCLSPNRNMRSQRGLKQRRQPRLAISRMR